MAEPLLTTAELAARADLTLGGVIVSPSTRTLRGPLGSVDVEPRVMQVLAVLADAAGQVVTRETLFNRCWGGVYVGDDSLNRAVAAVRKAVGTVGGRFEIDTIPRTGYVLKVPKGDGTDLEVHGQASKTISRRGAVVAGGAVVALGATGLWWRDRSQSDPRFEALMARGEEIVRKVSDIGDNRTIKIFEEAASIRPDSARAWGMLALVRSMAAQAAPPGEAAAFVDASQAAARKAFAINAKEPNALLAMFELEGSTLDWLARDRNLRQIIVLDPGNVVAITELVALLQSAGLNRESWNWNERALAIEPLSPDLLSRRALKLWVAGRVSQADKVIDQVRDHYPSYDFVAWVRFLILALSDRPRAAEALLESNPALLGPPPSTALWRACLPALDQHSPVTIAKARKACLEAAKRAGLLAAQGVMILSGLGQVDEAFDIADGFLLWRGSVVRRGQASKQMMNDSGWRIGVQWLFTPPCAVLRADPRFGPLCEGVGLADYWRARHVRPDYQLSGS